MPRAPKKPLSDAGKRSRAVRHWFKQPSEAKTRLLRRFIAELLVDFEEGGRDAIQSARKADPMNYGSSSTQTTQNSVNPIAGSLGLASNGLGLLQQVGLGQLFKIF